VTARKIVLRGVTREGKRFRPSDWAERLYHATATYGTDRRAVFPPFIRLVIKDELKCIEVDRRMEEQNPMLFDFLIGFGRDNHLAMTDGEGNPYVEQ
jgi:hypothetical protein